MFEIPIGRTNTEYDTSEPTYGSNFNPPPPNSVRSKVLCIVRLVNYIY
jgi:hypothetical protein